MVLNHNHKNHKPYDIRARPKNHNPRKLLFLSHLLNCRQQSYVLERKGHVPDRKELPSC